MCFNVVDIETGRVLNTKFTWHPVYKPYGTGLKNCFIENACIRSLLKWTFLTCN